MHIFSETRKKSLLFKENLDIKCNCAEYNSFFMHERMLTWWNIFNEMTVGKKSIATYIMFWSSKKFSGAGDIVIMYSRIYKCYFN